MIAPLGSGPVLKSALPPASDDAVELELRCKGWVPKQVSAGSEDSRVLGVQAFSLIMIADGATAQIFDANTGQSRTE